MATETSEFTALVSDDVVVIQPAGPARDGHRVWDATCRLVAVLLLLVTMPLMIAIALAIRAMSPGPALFQQRRVGRFGSEFVILKFRTMRDGAEAEVGAVIDLNECDGPLFKVRRDPRLSRVGRWLRRYSLDELPQLWNVARGEMALVGPRPPLPREVESYSAIVRRRLDVKPGMTGLWQVSGRSDLPWAASVQLDLTYVHQQSVRLDLAILARTPLAVLRGSGAY